MIENAPCGYLHLRPGGHIDFANHTFLYWSGYTLEQVSGKRFSDFLNMAGRIYYETHIAPLLRIQGFFNEFAIDLVRSDGAPLQMIANANERRGPDGRAQAIRIALIKATDRRQYERQLLDAREAARAAERNASDDLQREREISELREQFIAVLGHDLRNPLASISAGARILGRTMQTEKELQIVAMMQTTVNRMASLISDILDFARGRLGGGMTLERQPNRPLEPTLVQIVDELRSASPGRIIETEIHLNVPVPCDHVRIGQLASNLLGNALTHGAADRPVYLRAETTDTMFTLSVSNSGEPIPEAAMEKLFEPFFRGVARPSRQGLGLGLHISSQIAKAHGGQLSVISSPEETRFTFSMPLASPRESATFQVH